MSSYLIRSYKCGVKSNRRSPSVLGFESVSLTNVPWFLRICQGGNFFSCNLFPLVPIIMFNRKLLWSTAKLHSLLTAKQVTYDHETWKYLPQILIWTLCVQSSIKKVCSIEVSYRPNPDFLDAHDKRINSFNRLLCVADLIFVSYLFNTLCFLSP